MKTRAALTPGQRNFLAAWSIGLVGLGALALWLLFASQREDRLAARARHANKLVDESSESEYTPPAGHEKDVPDEVKAGVYVDRVYDFSVVDSSWKAEFFLWFTWTNPRLDPGETFHVVNGEIVSKTLMVRKTKGRARYAMYKVIAQTTKGFNVSRFPRDDHLLTLSIEDSAGQSYRLRYVADPHSDVSSRAFVPGYKITGASLVVKPHLYRTSRGDPDLPSDFKATYSQLDLAISIARPGWGLHFKMFVVLYAAVIIALLGLFLASSSDRLNLVAGALFAAVANVYITATMIPVSASSSLADELNWVGVIVIALAIVESVIYQDYFEGVPERARAGRLFDMLSFWILLGLYAAINVAAPLAASL